MFGSTVLEVGIGLIFTFLTVGLICGSVTETVATILSWRSKTLMDNIKKLVNDPDGRGLALELYNTALVHPRGNGAATATNEITQAPSYIDPRHFAQAMLDHLVSVEHTADGIKLAVEDTLDPQIKKMLQTMIAHAGTSIDTLRDHVAAWFDASMDRVSGEYKRWTQLSCFVIGLVIAIGLNIDTLHIATVMWTTPELTKAVASGIRSAQEPNTKDALNTIADLGLPIGWTAERIEILWTNHDVLAWIAAAIGWLLTAGSTLFGTSFWYDTLSSVLKLRGNGPAPATAPAVTAAGT